MRKTLFLLAFVLAASFAWAQSGNTVTIQTHGTPTGACAGIMRAVDIDNNLLYFCSNALWVAATAGGVTPSGTLTLNHVALGGGASVVKVDSACATNGSGSLSGCTSISTGTAPASAGATATGGFACTEAASTGWTPTAAEDYLRCDSTLHKLVSSYNGGTEKALPQLVASGTVALATGAIASGACTTAQDGGTATGVLTTDTIVYTPNADPTGVTGYAVSASGSLYIWAYPTADHVNFKVCNNTAGSLTPGALTLNWKVSR